MHSEVLSHEITLEQATADGLLRSLLPEAIERLLREVSEVERAEIFDRWPYLKADLKRLPADSLFPFEPGIRGWDIYREAWDTLRSLVEANPFDPNAWYNESDQAKRLVKLVEIELKERNFSRIDHEPFEEHAWFFTNDSGSVQYDLWLADSYLREGLRHDRPGGGFNWVASAHRVEDGAILGRACIANYSDDCWRRDTPTLRSRLRRVLDVMSAYRHPIREPGL